MTLAEEMEIITVLLKGIVFLTFAGILLTRQKRIEENSEKAIELLEYIADKIDEADAKSTLDDLENELNSNTRH